MVGHNDGPQPGDFWFADPPSGDLKIVEVVKIRPGGEVTIEPTGQLQIVANGWRFLRKVEVPKDLR